MSLNFDNNLENKLAPDFLIELDDSTQVSLTSFKGKYLILYFYPKDDTPGCTIEAKDFASLYEKFKSLDAVIIGISPDDLKSHNKFKTKHCLPFNLGYDKDVIISNAYQCWVEKSMFGKKYMGIERSSFLIDKKGILIKSWRKVSVSGHAEEVLKSLKEISN